MTTLGLKRFPKTKMVQRTSERWNTATLPFYSILSSSSNRILLFGDWVVGCVLSDFPLGLFPSLVLPSSLPFFLFLRRYRPDPLIQPLDFDMILSAVFPVVHPLSWRKCPPPSPWSLPLIPSPQFPRITFAPALPENRLCGERGPTFSRPGHPSPTPFGPLPYFPLHPSCDCVAPVTSSEFARSQLQIAYAAFIGISPRGFLL